MYLFTRTMRLGGGHIPESGAWAAGMAERVTAMTDLQVGLFMHSLSPGLGTIAFSTFVADLPALETANDVLMGNAEYTAAVNQGAAYIDGGIDDGLVQLVHGEPDPSREVQYAATVQTVCANGNLGRGIEVGVAIAQHAEKVTGVPTMFGMNVTGDFGGVGWISGYESMGQFEAAQQALMADATYLEMVDRDAGAAYTDAPSASTQTLWRRVV